MSQWLVAGGDSDQFCSGLSFSRFGRQCKSNHLPAPSVIEAGGAMQTDHNGEVFIWSPRK